MSFLQDLHFGTATFDPPEGLCVPVILSGVCRVLVTPCSKGLFQHGHVCAAATQDLLLIVQDTILAKLEVHGYSF